jgi:TonB family protein
MKCVIHLLFQLIPFITLSQIVTTKDDPYMNGVAQLKAGKLEEAKMSFTNAIAENKKDVNAYFNRGIVFDMLGSRDSACMDWLITAMSCDSEALQLVKNKCGNVYTVVEKMPQFPEGEAELFKYLMKNIQYPAEAGEKGITGRVYVTFIVSEDGTVLNPSVLRGLGYGTEEEVLRVVRQMPKWIPGSQFGNNVSVRYNLPVNFGGK